MLRCKQRTGLSGSHPAWFGDKDFKGKEGELQFKNGKIKGDTDGDGNADFTIKVDVETLKGDDFLL
jgi:hypothetical protein